MSALAPWEIEENERWVYGDGEPKRTEASRVLLTVDEGPRVTVIPTDGIGTSGDLFQPQPVKPVKIEIEIDPQTALELKKQGAYEPYLKFYNMVMQLRGELDEHLKKFSSPLFQGCDLESFPQRYGEVSRDLEDQWRARKESGGAVQKAIFLATELIKAFPLYRFSLPLEKPLRLIDCMRERLDSSQISLVLSEINKLPSAPYAEPSFTFMRCRACDRLISLYLRAEDLEKAIAACDCGVTLEDLAKNSRNRFAHRKKAIIRAMEKKKMSQNSWNFDYDAQFKKSISHNNFSDAALK
jgi:hypothetical protein